MTKIILVVPFSLVLFFGACSDSTQKKDVDTKKQVKLLEASYIVALKQEVPIWEKFNGTCRASSEQQVQTRIQGRLKEIFFKDGQLVKKGDKLFEIESDTLKSQHDEAKARLLADKAQLALQKADLDRYKPLSEDGLVPKQKYEQVQATYEALLAKIDMNKAIISQKKITLGYTTVVAPISGTIGNRLVDVGNLIGYDGPTTLAKIVQDNPSYAYFNPSEEKMQLIKKYRMQKNMQALIKIPTKNKKLLGDRNVRGTMDFSNSTVDMKTSTITSRAVFDNPDHFVLPGTFVYVSILVTDKLKVMLIPSSAVLTDQIGDYILVIGDGDIIKRNNVEVSYETGEFRMIQSGLLDGEKVIVSGFIKLRVGMKVKPKDATDTEGIIAVLEKHNLLSEIKE